MSRFSIVPLSLPRCALLGVALVLALSIAWCPPSLGVVPSGTASATALIRSAFVDGDHFRKGAGTATIYWIDQGRVLRLDPLKVSNGPNPSVYPFGSTAPQNTA